MKTKKINFKSTHLIRLEVGDEIIDSINNFCRDHSIDAGYFTGLAAVDYLKIARYLPETKSYEEKEFSQPLEVVSLFGVYSRDGIHSHIVVSDNNYAAFGGHLKAGKINGTAEIIFYEIKGKLDRFLDKNTNLNLIDI
jgi:hypothetical protein